MGEMVLVMPIWWRMPMPMPGRPALPPTAARSSENISPLLTPYPIKASAHGLLKRRLVSPECRGLAPSRRQCHDPKATSITFTQLNCTFCSSPLILPVAYIHSPSPEHRNPHKNLQ